jgi:microcystin-dependent protein
MSTCSNCYNGCTEIVSDKCVKYTGVDVPVLGIQTGDSLSFVEQALITFLTSTLDGTGIKIDIDPDIICALVQEYLPTCGDLTAVDLFNALIKATCDLQEQIDVIVAELAILNGNYDIDCLTGVTSSSDTHAIVQAVITKLCDVSADLVALALDLDTNYVKLADLNALIQAYLDSIAPATNIQYKKMVPYTAVEYYGPLSNFDASGAGLSGLGWQNVYLCNGNNGTPDKRGRVGVGAIQGVGGGALNPNVDPTFPGNPNYNLNMLQGTNTITLTTNQIPSHTHLNTLVFNNPDHTHFTVGGNTSNALITSSTSIANSAALGGNSSYTLTQGAVPATAGLTSPSKSNLTINYTNVAAGGGLSHSNIQPVLACYYIIYLP